MFAEVRTSVEGYWEVLRRCGWSREVLEVGRSGDMRQVWPVYLTGMSYTHLFLLLLTHFIVFIVTVAFQFDISG